MRRSSRLFRMMGAAALLISMLAAISPVAAQQDSPGGPTMDYPFQNAPPSFSWGSNVIFYPWVANDDNFGLGAADTSISVQNLQDRDGQIWIYVGNGNNGWTLATTAALSAYAAKTFTASQLGIASGDGAPVAVRGYTTGVTDITANLIETEVILSKPAGVEGDFTQVLACVVNIHTAGATTGQPAPFMAATDGPGFSAGEWVEWETQADLQAILEAVNAGNVGALVNPFGGLNADGDCLDATTTVVGQGTMFFNSLTIGGVAKMAVQGENLPYTTTADVAVSGYNALNGAEVVKFNNWYLPIVQTNCGPGGCWDSMIRVANLADLNSAVTIRFFPADDGSGSLASGFQIQGSVNGGDTWHVNLGDYVPEGWVGSAHILSDGQIFAMVDRYKVGYSMWVTNTGSAANFENLAQVPTHANSGGRYALFAPHVLIDWFGWNTGINVANLVEMDNNISIQYFNMLGNANQVLNQRLAPHGMTYFYDPSVGAQNISGQDVLTDPNAGVVGSAIIWSDYPVAAAVDATKYPESDPRGGPDLFQATSYNATQNVFTWQAVPLIQKGNPADGMGATSGINIMNPNPTAATVNVYFVNPSGFSAQNFGVSSVTIPGFANGFVYLMQQQNVPNGFVGAAQVIANVPVAVVSANVDYQVDGDGSAIFNAFNPCGLYRTPDLAPWQCYFDDPFDVTGRSVTKYFVDEAGEPVPGVMFHIINDNPDFPYQRNGISNVDGQATFTNVPVGNYELNVDSVPAGYQLPENPADTFTLLQGVDIVLTNELLWAQGVEKTVIVAGSLDGDAGMVSLSNVNVTIYKNIGQDFLGGAVAGEMVYDGQTGDRPDSAGSVRLAVGNYILCTWDEDGEAITDNGETVMPDLINTGGFGDLDSFCETFSVEAGIYTELINEVEILEGILNVFVFTLEPTDVGGVDEQVGVPGVEVCLIETGECAETSNNSVGFVKFLEVPEGSYTIEVQYDGYIVVNVDGGTMNVSNPVFNEDDASVTPAVVTFDYDPTADLAQDGWMDDVAPDGTPRGSFDLEIEVDESDAQLVQKTVLLNGEPVDGATVSITTADGEITNVVNDDGGTNIDDPMSTEVEAGPDGIVQFVVEPGTYTICSTVEIVLNPDTVPADPVTYDYEICEEDQAIDVTDPYIIYEFENDNVVDEVTKIVTLNGDPVGDAYVQVESDDPVIALVEQLTDADGEVRFILPPGTYELCSTIEVDVDGTGLNLFEYTLCEPVVVVGGDEQTITNPHVTGELTKVVMVRECEMIEETEFCTEYEAAVGVDVTVTIGGEVFGPYQTNANGEVFMIVPVDDDVLVGVCSDVNGDEICDGATATVPVVIPFVDVNGILTAEVTNEHTVTGFLLGQIDFGWLDPDAAVPNTLNATVCLLEFDGTDWINADIDEPCKLLEAFSIPANGTQVGWSYLNVPSGDYRISFTSTQGQIVNYVESETFTYSIVVDFLQGPIEDIDPPTSPPNSVGPLAQDGVHDFYITTAALIAAFNGPSGTLVEVEEGPLPGPSVLTVNPPSAAAGIYLGALSAFGPTNAVVLDSQLVLVNDGTALPTEGCSPLVGFPAGAIALVDRGTCLFTDKVANAQAAGAAAVIIINNVAGGPITPGGSDASITIPSMMISLNDGNVIKAGLPATGSVVFGDGGP